MRSAFAVHWEKLHGQFLQVLPVPQSYRADEHLKFAESFRRVPNGSRLIEPGQFLGFPAGTLVPQITLWEKARKRAAGDELPLFLQPEPFHAEPSIHRRARGHTPAKKLGHNLTDAEVRYCEERLRKFYPDRPRFDHLTFESERWVAKFKNSEADRNPSSVMREDFSTIHVVGRDAADLKPRALPYPLAIMLRYWRGQYQGKQGREDQAVTLQEVLLGPAEVSAIHPLEERFRSRVTNSDTAQKEMAFFFRSTVAQHPLLFAVGPEGVGKTTALMRHHHEFIADLKENGDSTLAMYAFADYDAAAKKCAAFNALQGRNGFVGVILPSFSRAYEEECAKLGVKPLSTEDAARSSFPSRWAAIEKLQPQVIERFRDRHTRLWDTVGERTPVFFTVHQVAHEWKKTSPTRLMWARPFWDEELDSDERVDGCRNATTLGLLVHDEVKVDSLVEMRPEAVLRWVDELTASDLDVWCGERPSLPKRLQSYEGFVAEQGYPAVEGNPVPVSFDEVQRITEVGGLERWDHASTTDTGEYGCKEVANDNSADETDDVAQHRDIYAARHGRSWFICPRRWWRGVAKRVVLLTTEAVPTAVARAADPRWAVFELETPHISRDAVEVRPSRFVKGDNLATLCAEFRAEHPDEDWWVISNKVAMMPETMTHAGARGSNDLIGRNVVQTMTFMTLDEYERLQALNSWTGRSDLVGLRHIDEFNQSAGRNLGFRKDGDVRHVLLANRRLFGLLMGLPTGDQVVMFGEAPLRAGVEWPFPTRRV